MANVYRVQIDDSTQIQPTAVGSMVNILCWVQMRTGTNPDFTWVNTVQGHFTIPFTAEELNTLRASTVENAAYRQAFYDLLKTKALAQGIDAADQAY